MVDLKLLAIKDSPIYERDYSYDSQTNQSRPDMKGSTIHRLMQHFSSAILGKKKKKMMAENDGGET